MNVVIFSGGSGSDFLQQGLYRNYPELNIKIITNAYDNGLSTGLIRTVFDGKILGPSDVRKNQSRHYSLKYGKDEVYSFIEHRFTSTDPELYVNEYFKSLDSNNKKLQTLYEIAAAYFKTVPEAKSIEYVDFSIGNIIYGYLAHKNNNSLQAAADEMRSILNIDQETILNSDESLFLQAITESGKILHDEADIVDYANENDKIVDIRFATVDGSYKTHSEFCSRAVDAVQDADLIIFSTGTQWSSLIPTYKCKPECQYSFYELIDHVKAKKLFLVNGSPDKDMYGCDGDDILDIVSDYLPIHNMTVVSGKTDIAPTKHECYIEDFGGSKYNKYQLAKCLMWLYFDKPTKDSVFVFDWDNTVVGRHGEYKEFSRKNVQLLPKNSFIITGNSGSKVDLKGFNVYADGGVNLYNNKKLLSCLDKSVEIDEEFYDKVKNFIVKYGFNVSMLQDRGNVCLSIKPLDPKYRYVVRDLLRHELGTEYDIECTGRTTIDIKHIRNNKLVAMKDIINKCSGHQIYFLGDELESGNDSIIEQNKTSLGVTTVSVSNPKDTYTFIQSIR